MEVRLGSVALRVGTGQEYGGDHLLEVFQFPDAGRDLPACIRLQIRREGEAPSSVPLFLTPAAARALAALLTVPLQRP